MDQPTPEETPRFLSELEAAAYLNCSRNSFRKFAKEKDIPVCKYMDRSNRYDLHDILTAVESTKQPLNTKRKTGEHDSITAKASSILRG